MIKQRVFNTVPGASTLFSHHLSYVRPLKVKLEGLGYDIVGSTPVGRQVRYLPAGTLFFGSTFSFPLGAKVYVLYND